MSTTNFTVNFIGAGTSKSGTTWLYKCLEEHPEICMAKPKEVHYFLVNNPKGVYSDKYNEDLEGYEDHFTHCSNEAVYGEFSPKYFFDPDAPRLIAHHFPNARIIISLRHPADRTISRFTQQLSQNPKHTTLQSAIRDSKWLNEKINYRDPLERFFKHFPKEQILLVFYEDLKHDPKSFIQHIFQFIGVDSAFVPKTLQIKHNVSKARNSKSNKTLKKYLFKTYRYFKNTPGLAALSRWAKQKGWNVYIIRAIDSITLYNTSDPKRQIDPHAKEQLKQIVQPEIERLEEFLGHQITQWH